MMKKDMIWGILLHLSKHEWQEPGSPPYGMYLNPPGKDSNESDIETWDAVIAGLPQYGINTVLIDVGDAIQYDSHPEISAPDAWSKDFMRQKLQEIRDLGMEPLPKLNFSAAHDAWMKEYGRMISTPVYYQVCADLIHEVCEVFRPKYFHLGMDEETWEIQKNYNYAVIRQNDMYWKDFYHLVNCVESENVRAWVWSDRMWDHMDDFLTHMPKDVLQSNWYYSIDFYAPKDERRELRIRSFEILDQHGFEQVPTGSNWGYYENLNTLVDFSYDKLSHEKIKGFMQTPWLPFIDNEKCKKALYGAADALGETIKNHTLSSVETSAKIK
jgi:hypothetical protein